MDDDFCEFCCDDWFDQCSSCGGCLDCGTCYCEDFYDAGEDDTMIEGYA